MKRMFPALFALMALCCTNTSSAEFAVKPGTGLQLIPATADQVAKAIAQTRGKAIVVNVWATWCQPCVEEFPDIVKLYQTYKDRGVRVIFVSADFQDPPKAAEAFLKKQGVDFTTFLKSGKDMDFINTMDPDWSGSLPATWIYDGKGKKRHFWEGKASYEKFEKNVLEVLND